jgi:hypothetical protein
MGAIHMLCGHKTLPLGPKVHARNALLAFHLFVCEAAKPTRIINFFDLFLVINNYPKKGRNRWAQTKEITDNNHI